MLKPLIGLILIAHGIGHTMGLFPLMGWARSEFWTGNSWALTPALGDASKLISIPIWLATTAGFIVVGMSFLVPGLPPAAIARVALLSSIVSLVGIALFANAFASPASVIGAAAIDLLVITSLFLRWPTAELAAP